MQHYVPTSVFTAAHRVFRLLFADLSNSFNSMDCPPPGSSVHGILCCKNTGEGCHALLQGILLTQGLNTRLLCLLHWQVGSLALAPPGKAMLTSKKCFLHFRCGSGGSRLQCGRPGFEPWVGKGKATHSSILAWRIPWTLQ